MKRILKIQYTLYVFFCIENALSNGYCTELNANFSYSWAYLQSRQLGTLVTFKWQQLRCEWLAIGCASW